MISCIVFIKSFALYKFHNKFFSLSLWSMAKLPCLDQSAQVRYLCEKKWVYYPHLPGLYSLSGRTSYRKISWSVEAARFMFRLLQSLLNLTGISAAALPNVRAIESLQHPISRLRDITRFDGKASSRLVNKGLGCIMCWSYPCKNIRSNQYVYKKTRLSYWAHTIVNSSKCNVLPPFCF